MIRNSKWFFLVLLAFSQAWMTVAQNFQPLRPGIDYLQITRGAKSTEEATGPFAIHLLKIDLTRVDVKIAHAMDEAIGLETVSSLAVRYGAIAAVNAGFFATSGTYRGDDVSVLKIDGKLFSEPANHRAAVGFIRQNNKTEIIFGHLTFNGSVEIAKGGRHKIDGVNRPRTENELIVFTPEFHKTTLTGPNGVEVVVVRNHVTQMKTLSGSTLIPEDGLVISAAGSARDWLMKNLSIGQRINLKMEMIPLEKEMAAKWQQAQNIIGGAPQLIRNGRLEITSELEKVGARFVTDRHPRTAIAKCKDGKMLLLVVDGRQPGYSTGMSLTSLAELLLEFGATDAVNLDGGGSTTMVLDGKVVNKPSDASGERPVSDGILIFEKTESLKQ